MARAPDWLDPGFAHIWLPYAQMKSAPIPLAVTGAQGARLKLADGRELIDGIASWWTVAHGYGHPHLVGRVRAQAETLSHVMLGGLANEQAYRLAARLAHLSGLARSRVFFSDSGSVAVEVALKMAMQFWLNQKIRARTKFVSFKGGYHGDTFATMAICDPDEGMHALFGPALAQNYVLDLPDTDERASAYRAFLRTHAETIAGVIVEPLVQGAGGMRIHSPQTLAAVSEGARAIGALVIFDEIFVGFNRTGPLWAHDAAREKPDILCLGKALTGGMAPLAATIASGRIFDAFWSDDPGSALMHGPTYMGNALACAAANASLDLFESEPRQRQVMAIERQLKEALEPARAMKGVRDVRVMGAIGVVELGTLDRLEMRQRLLDQGVWIRPFGNIVYVTPPLTISASELEKLTGAMLKAIGG